MRKIVVASAAIAGSLLMAAAWSKAQATPSVPNPQSVLGTGGDIVFVGRGGGRGGGGRGGFSRGGGGGFKGAYRGGGGRAMHAYRGGGGRAHVSHPIRGGRYAGNIGRYHGGNRHYGNRYNGKHYGNRYYGNRYYGYRRYGYWPWIGVGAYGYGSTNCDWLYRHNYRRWLAVCQ